MRMGKASIPNIPEIPAIFSPTSGAARLAVSWQRWRSLAVGEVRLRLRWSWRGSMIREMVTNRGIRIPMGRACSRLLTLAFAAAIALACAGCGVLGKGKGKGRKGGASGEDKPGQNSSCFHA